MRTLVHLSDLHFGSVERPIVEVLGATVAGLKPDVLVVSGDLTQRARTAEFEQAHSFLAALPFPQVVVPGNHDVPLYNVLARGLNPLAGYRRFVTDDLEPFYKDKEIAVLGINTARSLAFKGGRISRQQVARSCQRMAGLDSGIIRIVVTHHPFDLPPTHHAGELVGRAYMAMAGFARSQVDVFLSGHLHQSAVGETAARYKISGHSALVIQAGTATSTRGRGECNSWNLVRVERPSVVVERHTWNPLDNRFTVSATEEFRFSADGWYRVKSALVKSSSVKSETVKSEAKDGS